MNIHEFISKFNDIINYDIRVKMGGKKSEDVLYDKEIISYNNRKGRKYPYYKDGIATYKDATSISLPIDIEVTCAEEGYIGFEEEPRKVKLKNPIRYTNCHETKHVIRMIGADNSQIGFTILSLNPSGDITSRYSSYQNKDKTHEITRMMEYELDDNNKIRSLGQTSFIERKNNVETELTLYEKDKTIVSSSISRRSLDKKMEPEYISITDLASDINREDIYYYSTRCYYNSFLEAIENEYGSFADYTLCSDLTSWKNKSRQAEEWKKSSQSLREYRLYASNSFLEYVEDDENDLTKYIPGEYVGHLFTRDENSSTLYIRTKAEDFEQNTFFYYTKVDLTGCDPFIGANPLDGEEKRDQNYFQRIKDVRGLEYVTQNIEGQEVLIWTRGKEEQEKNKFNEIFIEPYEDIEKIKIGKILSKQK